MSVFSYSGSLDPENPLYVGREDKLNQLVRCVTSERPKYALIFGSPRMGKTSLIRRLRYTLPQIPLFLIDVGQQGEHFYQYLSDELIRRCEKQQQLQGTRVHNGSEFQEFLRQLNPPMTTVIVLEHLMYVPDAILRSFADILRNTYEVSREIGNASLARFCFLLTGGIELLQAVHDSVSSPLMGLAESIYLEDFTHDVSDILLSRGFGLMQLPEKKIAFLCRHIYDQVHGHPYLTQRVAHELAEHWQAGHALQRTLIIDTVTRLLNDDQRIASMLNKIRKEMLHDTLYEIVSKTQRHPWHGSWKTLQIEAIGLIRDEKGYYVVRNPAYARRLAQEFGPPPASNGPTPSPPTVSPAQTRNTRLRLQPSPLLCKLQFTQQDHSFMVRASDSLGVTTSSVPFVSPYTPEQFRAICKALLPLLEQDYPFREEQQELLQQIGLWNAQAGRLVPNPTAVIGRQLYHALMVGEVGEIFERVLLKAVEQNTSVALQLCFDPNATELARYPWELLHHRTYDSLILSGRVEVLRFMTYAADHRNYPPLSPPLRVLYIRPRPSDVALLLSNEQEAMQRTLEALQEQHLLDVQSLDQPTFDALDDYLSRHDVHLLHFDGHGRFGRRCPNCTAVNLAHYKRCQNRECGQDISDVDPSGYLSFVQNNGTEDLVDNVALGHMVARYNIRLAVLSACYSGTVEGETLFSGVAQSLLKQGIMAAISTQLPISPEGAASFVQSFYQALIETKNLVTAIAAGRRSLQRNYYRRITLLNEWFVTTLSTRANLEELEKIIT